MHRASGAATTMSTLRAHGLVHVTQVSEIYWIMPCYQILSAVRPVSRAQLDKIARNATKLLVKDGGVVRRIHKNENVKFAFTYKGKGVAEKHDFGSWLSIDAVASVNAMKTLTSELQLSEDVLRVSSRKISETVTR